MDPIAIARSLDDVVRAHAPEGERARRLPAPVVEALRPTGLLRMAVPHQYGGPEIDPLTQLEVVETIGASDGATGWCVGISSTTSSMSWFLEPAWAEIVFGGDQTLAYGGAFAPTGTARRTPEGWRCDGRWSWGSGTQHCAWINGGCVTDTDEFHLVFFEADQVEILDTWDPSGLRGTGSHDFVVRDALVPAGRSLRPGVDRHQVDCALARFPNFNLLAATIAAVALGIARRAIDELVELGGAKTPAFSRSKLAEYAPAQLDLARATAAYRGGRAFLHEEIASVWASVQAGDRPSIDQRASVRLACAHAATEAARAVDLCYTAAGGSAVHATSPLQRCLRDVHTATQHLLVSDRNLVTFGRERLGLDIETVML